MACSDPVRARGEPAHGLCVWPRMGDQEQNALVDGALAVRRGVAVGRPDHRCDNQFRSQFALDALPGNALLWHLHCYHPRNPLRDPAAI